MKGAGRYLKWITNRDQLYSTWNSTQYYVQPDWEETLGRMDTYICIAESLCCPPETLSIFLTILQYNI